MKKNGLVLFLVTVVMLAFTPLKKSLVGNWTIRYVNGTQVSVEFRRDGKFESKIPAENFIVGGKYELKEDVLSISDTSCNENYWGKYRLTFITDDSVFSEVMEDSCVGRRSAVNNIHMIRVK